MELKHIDFKSNFIDCGEKKYRVEKSLSITRFIEFEKLQQEVGWGVDFQTLFDKHKQLYELLNKQKFADCAVTLHNLMQGIARRVDAREHPALLLCTLFINEEGEDLSKWDEQKAGEKIETWKGAGYDVNDFFCLATSLVAGFLDVYREVSPSISEKPTKKSCSTLKSVKLK